MKFIWHIIRLSVFSIAVSLVISAAWVAATLARPDLMAQATDYAWDTVEFTYAAIEYGIKVAFNDEKSDLTDLENSSIAEFLFTESPPLELFSSTKTPKPQFNQEGRDCSSPVGWEIHLVQAGDTLQAIAAIFQTDAEIIKSANCLPSPEIFIGQRLFVPSLEGLFTPLVSATVEPSITPTITFIFTPLATATKVPTLVPSLIPSPLPTINITPTLEPSNTSVPSLTFTPNPTNTKSPSATSTVTSAPEPSVTNLPTRSPTPTTTSLPLSPTASPTGPSATPTVDLSGCDYNTQSSIENQILDLLNLERAKVGLPPLIMQSQLRGSAREHSADMACNSFVSHTGSNGSTNFERITSYGYYPSWWGENIYMGWQTTPEEVMTWWMNSEPHRDNILHSYYVHIGIGHAVNGNSAAYTLNFGSP